MTDGRLSSPNSRIWCNNVLTHFVYRQIKIQIAKPPMVDREDANNGKIFFQDDEDGAHSKKNNIRNIKKQQKTFEEVMQPSVFPKWRSHSGKQTKQRTHCLSKHRFSANNCRLNWITHIKPNQQRTFFLTIRDRFLSRKRLRVEAIP